VAAVDRFLAVSEFVRDRHVDAGFPSERVVVKPNFVRSTVVREGPGTHFLVLSRMSVEKGLDELVQAWKPELGTLRVVGDGPLRAQIERLAAGRGVQVEPPIEPNEVPSAVAAARAVLIPSACYEGQPRVALEAYAAGVPIVVSRLGALPELVDGGETGLTVAPGDLDGWRAAARVLADDETSRRLGAGALRRWESMFSPERGLRALESAYAAACESRDAQSGADSSSTAR
jgi:glycosyltransferase involved in cell wall biosynthesis